MVRGVLLGGLFLGAAAVSGCQTTSTGETMVVCDGKGCVERPSDHATFDPSAAVPDPDPEGRLPTLVAEAERDPRAAYDLAMRYMRGDGIRQNSYQAVQWMRDAGERGDLRAQSALGRLYLTGLEEMGPDYNEAQKWLSMAAARGDAEAAELLAEAEAGRADARAYEQALVNWRRAYTGPWWYRSRYYGYWGPRCRRAYCYY